MVITQNKTVTSPLKKRPPKHSKNSKKQHIKYQRYTKLTDLIEDEFGLEECRSDGNNTISFYFYDKYHSDDYEKLFSVLGKYLKQPAEIFCTGEDGEKWKLKYMNNELEEYSGETIFSDETTAEDNEIMQLIQKLTTENKKELIQYIKNHFTKGTTK